MNFKFCLNLFAEIKKFAFFSDIMINFKTTYVNKKGEVITDSKSIVANYLRGWFICDLLGMIKFLT